MEIQGYPNYIVYEDGRIQNKKTKRFLKQYPDKNGYLVTQLYNDGKCKTQRCHRIVANHYIPNPDNLPDVDHINRNPTNNHVSNLRWCSRVDNLQNKGKYKNNKLNIKHISAHSQGGYIFYKRTNNKKHQKYFRTLQEAIDYKKYYLERSL